MQAGGAGERGGVRLAVRELACRRGDRVLFSGLSLNLAGGDLLHAIGPNGVGKSSLLRLLGGLARPFAGSVEREGSVGLLDERPALDPALPLGRALAFWAAIDRGEAAAGMLGLGDLLDVPVRYLSTGQRKRAGLARLIGQGAAIWLLDEPFNGLDDAASSLVGEIIGGHCRAGGLCVMASHLPFAMEGKRSLHLGEWAA